MAPETECGTIAARTRFYVTYRGADGPDVAEFESCCAAHRPSEMVILLDEAEVTQLIIADGYEQRITDREGTRHTFNPRPGHCIAPDEAWSWTRINGLSSIFEPAERLERR